MNDTNDRDAGRAGGFLAGEVRVPKPALLAAAAAFLVLLVVALD